MCKPSIVVAIVLLFATSYGSAEPIYIGNSSALEDWDRAAARVWVYDSSLIPPIRMLDEEVTSGPAASVVEVSSVLDGLVSASAEVDAYNLTGYVETDNAPNGVSAAAQIRDQIYVEADFGADTVLEFEFALDYSADVEVGGFAEFQFSLLSQQPDATFVFFDPPAVDFGLGDGPYTIETGRTFTVSTALAGADEVLISSGTYVPLQFTLIGTIDGTGSLDFLNTLELIDFTVLDESGSPVAATTSSSLAPANPLFNSTPIPEPTSAVLLSVAICLVVVGMRKVR